MYDVLCTLLKRSSEVLLRLHAKEWLSFMICFKCKLAVGMS